MFQNTPKHGISHKLWKSYLITNYISLMRPYTISAFLMGFLPYKIESSNFVISALPLIYSTIMIIAYFVSVIFSFYLVNAEAVFLEMSDYLHSIFIFILGLLIFFLSYVSHRQVIRMMQKMLEVSRMLSRKVLRDMAKWYYTKSIILIIPLLSFTVMLNNIYGVTCWYTFMGVCVLNNLYIYNVSVLGTCFEQINDSLVQVRETLINDRPHILRRVYHTQKNPVLLSKLRVLKKQHNQVSNVVQILNESLSRPNLSIIALLFMDITFNIYRCVMFYTENGRIKQWFSFSSMFVFYYSLHLVLTVLAVENTRSEMVKVGSNIHRIIVRTFDEEMTNELEMFSLQVLQTDNTFSAKGLEIDATLLTKVLSCSTTCLLILIQLMALKTC